MAKSAAVKTAAKRNVIPLSGARRTSITTGEIIDRSLAIEIVRVTERAAVAAARLRGRGDEQAADEAAVAAMRRELNRLAIHGEVVIGEGDRDSGAMLCVGEEVGDLRGPRLDIAVDPLEGVTLCAKAQANAISVIAFAEPGTLLKAPNVYMNKVAIGPAYAPDTVHLDAAPEDNIHRLAKAKGVRVSEIVACILDRPRHGRLIEAVRATGASIRLISDGDISAVIDVANSDQTGVDIYIGSGGAPEGVLAAAALKCIGGHMQGRLMLDTPDARRAAAALGVKDPDRIYGVGDMARGDVLFAATGVTDGGLLSGVRFGPRSISTETIVMRSSTLTSRRILAEHSKTEKFHLD